MASERFNHKYGHCTGQDCKTRDDCAHYMAYLEALALGLKDIKTYEHCENMELGYVRVVIGEKVENFSS